VIIPTVLLPLLSLLATPAHAGSAVNAEYARQVSAAQIRLAQLEALLVESELRIEQLEEVIRRQGRTEADRLENLDQVNTEVTRLRGSIEVLQFQTAEMKRVLDDQTLSSDRRQLHAEMRLAQIEKLLDVKPPPPPTDAELGVTAVAAGAAGTAAGAGATPSGAAPTAAEVGEIPEGAANKLELAISHMEAGRQAVARAILKAAIEQDAGAPEMDEIRYRYAETFFNEGDWRTSISEFNKVTNNHPNSPWKCWAFYRMGEAFEHLGQNEGAKAFFKGASEENCKNSDAAKEAKKKL
jgi:TolA-binding protein